MIYLLYTISYTAGGSRSVHIYTQKIYRTTKLTQRTKQLGTEQHNELNIYVFVPCHDLRFLTCSLF